MKILAFESSCDETAVAVVEDGRKILSDAIASQADLHALYGGVVPEIASRKHIEAIAALTDQALKEAGKTINIPLITKLTGQGVSGSQVLDGNEEQLGNYNFPISIDWRRHGVRVPKSTSYKTEIDLLNAARDMLREW